MTSDPSATEPDTTAGGSVIPVIRFMRGEGERRATFFELFFDLVYVFAITQLSHHLLANLAWSGAAEATFLLVAVYWAWNYTTWMANWFDPQVTAVRLLLTFVMLASLFMAVAIPEAFGDHGFLFVASYCALQVGRNAFVVASTPGGAFHRNFQQILAWSVLSVPFWLGGALVDGNARWAWWLGALGLDLAAPLVRFRLPRWGTTPMAEWQIDPGHFAERFQLLIIIVLGESIVVSGATASEAGLEARVVAALAFTFVSTVSLWWLYFGQVAATSVRRMEADDTPGALGRDAYTYLHLPIVAGILVTAVGQELVLAHPQDELGTAGALAALGGLALYLVGIAAWATRVGWRQRWAQLGAVSLLVAAVPLAADAEGLLVSGISTALLVLLVVVENVRVPGAGVCPE